MAGKNNLKVPTSEEAREYGRRGGKASAESRRAKKTMQEYAKLLLSLPVSGTKSYNQLSQMGIAPEVIDNKMLVVVGLLKEASKGNVAAVKELRNLVGEDGAGKDEGVMEELIEGLKNV